MPQDDVSPCPLCGGTGECRPPATWGEWKRLHDAAHARVADLRREMQARCPHGRREYVPDPSGNSGSYYECADCGAEV